MWSSACCFCPASVWSGAVSACSNGPFRGGATWAKGTVSHEATRRLAPLFPVGATWANGGAVALSRSHVSMIRLDNISKQNGHQLLFIEASAALLKGEKVGLVGPNGSGKTTLFRMITGQEQPDEGQVAVDRGVSIGDFSQDVGELSARSPVTE